ncbi:PREDICTED: neuroblastoma-amplified sequence-like [Dufourea novaeangliae]|uniref:Neuroblastoma-amplified sequence n=1 Tax=Dufourea novaeangliae TaxID=178035 RepID=A0A154PMZ6_DUFNO|nr:PREDICTED: neuroblastoma-amplified sequence-like [Dufourea novaeangliae]KZC12834.1 Neuroblastoma-amplified sequence [Dufourea novaeangliae]
MINCNEVSSENEPILYELLEYFVRKQEPELIKCKNDAIILPTTGTIKNALRYLNNRYSLPESISQQISLTLPWKFAIGDSGRLLAVLQENVIEIRKAKDEYSSVVGKACVPKDAFSQWRKLSWSPDGTLLVLASSNGCTSFYNALGNNIFNISPKTVSQNPQILEAGDAIASMIFLKPRTKSEKWSYEFMLITYSGLLRSYHISLNNGFEANYEFSFGHFYKNGVNAVVYDEKHCLFYVAGNTITRKLTSTASESGLTSWRPLDDYPYCKLTFAFDDESKTQSRFSIWNIIPSLSLQPESIIFKIKISPNSQYMICMHTDGSISLWGLPNLLLQKKWKLSEQPDFNIPNPFGHAKLKKFPPGITEFHPLDIGWWSDQTIIIARYAGSISVCATKNLKNLLGTSPEFLTGQPQICELGSDRGFLCLDSETFITSKKRNRESNVEGQISEASSESEEEDELEPVSILNYTTNLMQSTLYSITDIERFQPKRKKSKVLFRTYRILGLKSTTPEELYSRKIDIEEYEEALALANTYNLDTDLVYQTQWRKSKLSLNAIQEHLSKVTKRSWVLHECVTRVPDTIEAARELLNFGLKGANLETLIAVGTCDNGKFVADNTDEDWNDMDEVSVSLRQAQKANVLLDKIDVNNLSDAQIDLIKYRRKLLHHLDKLLTYEIILGSSLKYDKNFYEEFRQLSAVENAIRFAKNSDCQGVEIMFTYYGESLLPHWLAIISFFPETLNPLKYKELLPKCDTDNQLFLLDQQELRQKDWSEKTEFNEVVSLDNDDKSELLYESNPSLSVYRGTTLTPELLQKWYESRAYQIERNSYMVDNALQLIKIGKSHNINGLENLLFDLETLDDLLYKVYLEDLSLDQLQKLSNLEKIKLLMSMTTEKSFVDDIKNFVLPFIKRIHQYLDGELQRHLFNDYLICISQEDLKLPVKLFEYLKVSQDNEILQMIEDISTLALDCTYACNDPNMYEKAMCIVESVAKDRDGKRSSGIISLLEELDRELECTKILNKYDVKTTLNALRKNKSDPEVVKQLLVQMARTLHKIVPTPDERQWTQLLNEMLEIHSLTFTCVDIEICFEICVSSRLVSGVKSNIQTCAALIETKKNEQSLLKVSYEKAVNLILEASKEYFNSSKSLTDSNMELAKACLHLIVDDNAQIKEEYDLINSLQILNEFNVHILPLQVRLMQDRLKLIQDCLNRRADAHKSRQRLLTLATYLRIEVNNSRAREGKVLELIARKALEVKDFSVCATICQQLMQNNYVPAWSVAFDLGCCEGYDDLKTRQKCLWFAINKGPNDILNKALDQIHLIEIQMLHKDLELWIPPDEPDNRNDADDVDSEEEFIDAMTTPQMETKEFVPKVLEASTEIVKTSASIMKKSTFGLIKNISDTNFWKSRLSLGFASDQVNDVEHNDKESHEDDNDVQSFPCFYECLHERGRLSNLDTKYVSYSMPDIENTKLRCCRAFLRITMLSESSCYGLEVSDINHLFLECAKHTIQEDWLLGMSYLFSIQKNCIKETQHILTELAQTELYSQTAMYYYSLVLHKQLYRDFENLYLFKPLSLMRKIINIAHKYKESDIYEGFKYWQTRLLNGQEVDDFKFFDSNQIVEDNPIQSSMIISEESKEEKRSTEELTSQIDGKDKVNKNYSESNIKDEVEWTNDWGNFSDEDIGETIENKKNIPEHEADIDSISLAKEIGDCKMEKDRFEAFERVHDKIRTENHYYEIKEILLQWPKFNDPVYTTIDKHPILKMMKLAIVCIHENDKNYNKQIFQEYKDLMEALSSQDVFKEFLNKEEIPLAHAIYIRLNMDDPVFHAEAINILNERHKEMTLTAPILETLFLKNLTASFDPNHEVYGQVIEHVLVNRSLSNTRKNAEILVRELKKNKHISHALCIIRLMEDIPPSLCTFDTCFELLMKNF